MKEDTLTCISIELDVNEPYVSSSRGGTLNRYIVKFSDGKFGEYWAQSEASKKYFPLHKPRKYEYEELSKHGGIITLKFYPVFKKRQGGQEPPSSGKPPQPQVIERNALPRQPALSQREKSHVLAETKSVDIAAVTCAVTLAAAGKIPTDEILLSALELKKMMTDLAKP